MDVVKRNPLVVPLMSFKYSIGGILGCELGDDMRWYSLSLASVMMQTYGCFLNSGVVDGRVQWVSLHLVVLCASTCEAASSDPRKIDKPLISWRIRSAHYVTMHYIWTNRNGDKPGWEPSGSHQQIRRAVDSSLEVWTIEYFKAPAQQSNVWGSIGKKSCNEETQQFRRADRVYDPIGLQCSHPVWFLSIKGTVNSRVPWSIVGSKRLCLRSLSNCVVSHHICVTSHQTMWLARIL